MKNNSNNEKLRLNKAIALSGLCSRRKADELITAKKVKVNNKLVTDLSLKVSIEEKIEVNGKKLIFKDFKYILLYKPKGFITTTSDERGRETIIDLLPKPLKHLKTSGRLDRDSEGLIIMSNDGQFLNEIQHPSKNVEKEYIVKLDKFLSNSERKSVINRFIKGIKVGDEILKAFNVGELTDVKAKDKKQTRFMVVLHGGKYRQIRRMFQALGFSVKSLKRIRIGNFDLGNIQKGKYLELTKQKAYAILQR